MVRVRVKPNKKKYYLSHYYTVADRNESIMNGVFKRMTLSLTENSLGANWNLQVILFYLGGKILMFNKGLVLDCTF